MKIALMGSHPESARLAPFMDQTHAAFQQGIVQDYPPSQFQGEKWDIWPCSPGAMGYAPRATRWFELHRWEPGQPWFSPQYVQFLCEFNGPVYVGGPIPEIKNAVLYPLRRVEAEFSSAFLTSSLSLMAALAILTIEDLRELRPFAKQDAEAKGDGGKVDPSDLFSLPAHMRLRDMGMDPKQIDEEMLVKDEDDEIGWWGVDMSANEEYSRQKPGAWFFGLEILRRGIAMRYPPESDLFCFEPPYGLCEWDPEYVKATCRMREFNQRIAADQQQHAQLTAQMAANAGAKDNLNYHIKTNMNPFRLPAGVKISIQPGTGLGAGQTDPDRYPSYK